MKKSLLIITLFCLSLSTFSQENSDPLKKKNEISSNLLDLVVAGSLNFNYERLLENNQSLMAGVTFFDTYGYYDAGQIEKSTALTFDAAYLIYFSKDKDHYGFFFYPQLRARTGKVTIEGYTYFDFEGEVIEEGATYDVSGVSAGFGIGHKWLFNNKFTLSITGDIARNLGNFDTNYLDNIEARFGVNFGYRF